MKLSLKLPLVFTAALVCMLVAALYGIYSLHQSLSRYEDEVQTSSQNERAIAEISTIFKMQVQEWKDTLLRGKDPAALDKHWTAFTTDEAAVAQQSQALLARLQEGEAKALIDRFMQAHAQMGRDYRKGLEDFKAANADPAAGDAAVKGMDRAPALLLKDAVAHVVADSALVARADSEAGRRATVVSVVLMLVVCVCSIGAAVLLSRSVVRQLGGDPQEAVDLADMVAQGNLGRRVVLAPGDTHSLMAQLKTMQERLVATVGRVRQGAEGVATASAEIAKGNQDLSGRTESQASALQQTAASMEQLNATVKQNAQSAQQVNQLAQSASRVAEQGGDAFAQVVDTMRAINDSAHKIAAIISVIDGIAFQTNILALNAAVEAARAGEQGRGFAVVASEVRSLAGRSAEAAKEIKSLIQASVERVEHGSTLVDQAGSTMNEVVHSIRRVTDLVAEISAASGEQAVGVSQVGDAVAKMDQVTQQNAALVEEMAAAATSLKAQAGDLVQAVSVFTLGSGSASESGATMLLRG